MKLSGNKSRNKKKVFIITWMRTERHRQQRKTNLGDLRTLQ